MTSISISLNQFLLLISKAFSSFSFFILIFSGTWEGILFSNERFVTCVEALWTNPKVANRTMQPMAAKVERTILRFKSKRKDRCMMRKFLLLERCRSDRGQLLKARLKRSESTPDGIRSQCFGPTSVSDLPAFEPTIVVPLAAYAPAANAVIKFTGFVTASDRIYTIRPPDKLFVHFLGLFFIIAISVVYTVFVFRLIVSLAI